MERVFSSISTLNMGMSRNLPDSGRLSTRFHIRLTRIFWNTGLPDVRTNIALDLAMHSEDYFRKAERVIDFFVNYCITEMEWVYSLYDTEKGAPFASFGDASAPRLHICTTKM